MKRALRIVAGGLALAVGAFTAGVLWPLEEPRPAPAVPSLAIVDVTVIDVIAGVAREHQTVVIRDAVISNMGAAAATAVPSGATTVEGGGRYLIPALWDMHAHVYAFAPLLDLPLYIAYGVTNVRDMQGCPLPDDPFIACADDKRRWTAEALAGRRVAPRIVGTTSFMANGPGVLQRLRGVPAYFGTATPDEARAFVRHFAGQADAIKVYDRIPREPYFALVDEARRLGLAVVGHRPHAVSAVEAAARQKSLEHARFLLHESFAGAAALRAAAGTPAWREDRRRMLDEHDPAAAAAIFAAMARAGTYYVPTHLTRWVDAYAGDPAVREDPLLRYLHPLMRWQWLEDVDATLARDPSPEARETYRQFHRKGLELTGQAHRAGVKVLAGTDYIVAGADLHRELQQLVEAGLSPGAALRAATLHAAEYFGLEGRHGSVASGNAADLVLLGGDPLADIRNTQRIEAVIFNGALYDRAALDGLQRHVERRARSFSVACKILWRFITNPVAY
jgi:imidazolonepropionase-like amidohydrolase